MATSEIAKAAMPQAISFTKSTLQILLSDGTIITAPLNEFPLLRDATDEQRLDWRWVGEDHEGIHWPQLDEDISTHNLMRNDRKLSDPVHQVPFLIADLFRITDHLGRIFQGRPFTPDGHLMGSIGEVVAKHVYGLTLEPCSSPGIDARTADGGTVQIKLTGKTGTAFAFSWSSSSEKPVPDFLLCLKYTGTEFVEIYNGEFPRSLLESKRDQSNGQVKLGINALAQYALNKAPSLPQLNSLQEFNSNFHFELDSVA